MNTIVPFRQSEPEQFGTICHECMTSASGYCWQHAQIGHEVVVLLPPKRVQKYRLVPIVDEATNNHNAT